MVGVANPKMQRQYATIKARHKKELKEFMDRWKVTNKTLYGKMDGQKRLNNMELLKQDLIEWQDNCCAICEEEFNINGRLTHLDHCHERMQVREVLCVHCNVAIGQLFDDVELMTKAIKYIEKHEAIYLTGNYTIYRPKQ